MAKLKEELSMPAIPLAIIHLINQRHFSISQERNLSLPEQNRFLSRNRFWESLQHLQKAFALSPANSIFFLVSANTQGRFRMPFPHYWKSRGRRSLTFSGQQNARGYDPNVWNKRWPKTSSPSSIRKGVAKALGFELLSVYLKPSRDDHRTSISCRRLTWGALKSPSVSAQLLRSLERTVGFITGPLHICSA